MDKVSRRRTTGHHNAGVQLYAGCTLAVLIHDNKLSISFIKKEDYMTWKRKCREESMNAASAADTDSSSKSGP